MRYDPANVLGLEAQTVPGAGSMDRIKRLGRLLIPLESMAIGTYGHDPYGLTA